MQIQNIFRLCRRRIYQNKRFNHVRATEGGTNNENVGKSDKRRDFKSLLSENQHKITFNSYLEHEKLELGYFRYYVKTVNRSKREQQKEFELKKLPPLPVSLQYIVSKDKLLKEESEDVARSDRPERAFQLPFANTTQVQFNEHDSKPSPPIKPIIASEDTKEFDRSDLDRWMTNYEYYDDTKQSEIDNEWVKQYGTPDPAIGVSNIPCGGCGALLHCSDPAIPGYLPSEIYKFRNQEELRSMECQRCHFLKEYNIALDVSVQPEEFEKLLQSIKYVKSLVLLMVDLLDFPCSIWPGIVDIIGTDRPIFIVANKVDLLPGDSFGYLKRVKESLKTEIKRSKLSEANIKYIALISAKTGYGVEDLVSALFKYWMYKGDVFLVGCTNVGKSSLFNALLQSDYCKVYAVDIVKRATVSRWPGTTLNLLKFPINRPSGWKIYERTRRLKAEAKLMQVEKDLRKAQVSGLPTTETPALIGHIGRSFSVPIDEEGNIENDDLKVLDEKHKLLARSKWFYDTPGVIHPDQVLSLLSTEELLLTIPKTIIRPQTYYLKPGSTLFVGGLARIDLVESELPVRFTVFCAETLPLTVTLTDDAQDVYEKFVGTELFAVPSGGEERLRNWPGLAKHEKVLKFKGGGPKVCCGDVVLSSIAWVGVTAKGGETCGVLAWTPEGRGVYRRYPPVLPYAINLKGKRLRDTPAYMVGKVFSEND